MSLVSWRDHLEADPERLAGIYYVDAPECAEHLCGLFRQLHQLHFAEDAGTLTELYLKRLSALMENLPGDHPVVAALTDYCLEIAK